MSRRKPKLSKEPIQANVTALSHEGRGIAHIDSKAVFIRNALPNESVTFTYLKKHRQYAEGIMTEVLTPSENRVIPKCKHFGICGGCNLQHLAHEAQIAHKQQVLLEQLKHIAKVIPEHILPPLTAATWGYRHKARLGAKYVQVKEKMFVGFREVDGRFLAEIDHCPVLHPAVGEKINALKMLIQSLSIYQHVPQVEVAVGEHGLNTTDSHVAMILRHLAPLTDQDTATLCEFAKTENIKLYLQPSNADSIHRIWPQDGDDFLHYYLPDHQIDMRFEASDFTQINPFINRQMINLALDLLALEPADRVLDLFCGLGNFTLPIARKCEAVIGVEGAPDLVKRAQANAIHNHIANATFYAADLTKDLTQHEWAKNIFDKVLLDPPRTGALETIAHLSALKAKRIVYVSCNPATLARDASVLCQKGYILSSAGIMDMFPHTGHVESIAVFVRR
ncbi:MAG: rRNA methyltransferase [Gammaproteobacteria bacterium]|jgi:23S rRNA (uracil1939-C5)-methyltransferase|nr:rRNA methyltransferase [Gammaproteobacteria bacterium]